MYRLEQETEELWNKFHVSQLTKFRSVESSDGSFWPNLE